MRKELGISLLSPRAGLGQGGTGGNSVNTPGVYLSKFLPGMGRWRLKTPTPL